MVTKKMDIPPFEPEADAPRRKTLEVLTVRVTPETREELHQFFRRVGWENYTSVSHIVQTAIRDFLDRNV